MGKLKVISVITFAILLLGCSALKNNNEKRGENIPAKINGIDNRINEKRLYFNSRDLAYKSPFGAVAEGTKVTFNLHAEAGDLEKANLIVMIESVTGNQEQTDYSERKAYPMEKSVSNEKSDEEIWTAEVTFNKKATYVYYFEAVDGETKIAYTNNNINPEVLNSTIIGLGGEGKARKIKKGTKKEEEDFPKYKETVYDKNFKTPDWAKDVIFYYIFPERFKNGNRENDPKPGIDKFYGNKDVEFHQNWNDPTPWVPGGSDGCVTDDNEWCNDFYGGDIAGITQKLDYLKELGINTIYTNPIFEAPSNHKYDTADYKKIDNNFGTLDEFKLLVEEAKKRGIRIILDVSLNHSGSDSVYMDRYGKYEGTGAFENEVIRKDSPYYDWYEFRDGAKSADEAYNQWANPTLANLKESESWKNFAFREKDSVMKYWLAYGTGGWRMDVAPWVSDEFWREWRKEIKKSYSDSLLICETWFDSSKYFLGDMFDSTMNYIFREAALNFAKGKDAKKSFETLEMTREYYPEEAYYSLMNLLSTHDATRALYELGYKRMKSDTPEKTTEAKKRLILSVFLQMTYPGAPSIYYGDEAGVTGGEDPDNRAPYPWREDGGNPDDILTGEFKKLTKMRNENEVFRRGTLIPLYTDSTTIIFAREYRGKFAISAMNNGKEKKTVTIKLKDRKIVNKISEFGNGNIEIGNGEARIEIEGMAGTAAVFDL